MDMSITADGGSGWTEVIAFVVWVAFLVNLAGVFAGAIYLPSSWRGTPTRRPPVGAGRLFLGTHAVLLVLGLFGSLLAAFGLLPEGFPALTVATTLLAALGALAWWYLLSNATPNNAPSIIPS